MQNIILVGAKPPVAFFAYPDRPSQLHRPGTGVCELARDDQDVPGALAALCDALDAGGAAPERAGLSLPGRPTGTLTPEKIGAVLAASMPENAIVVNESITTGRTFLADTEHSRPHDWILGTGRLDRVRAPLRHRRGDRLPRPQGHGPGERRQRDVHAPGAVDPGP